MIAVGNSRRREAAVLAAILLVAAGLRLVGIGRDSVWSDEVVTMSLARQDGVGPLLEQIQQVDATRAPLHPILLRAWIGVFGDHERSARLLSAACGLAMVGLVYLLGLQTYGRPVAGWAAWLAAISPIDVYHSREIRMYALLALITCACWSLLLSFRRSATPTKKVAFGVALIALVYSHPLGCLMVAALAVGYLATRPGSRLTLRSWAVVHAALAMALAPWLFRYLDHPPETLTARLTAWHLLEWPEMFHGGRAEAVIAYMALVAWGIWANRKPRGEGAEPEGQGGARVATATLLAWLVVPPLLLLAYSLARHPIFGPRRYLLFVGPAYLLLVARGLASLPKWPRYAAAIAGTLVAASVMERRVFEIDRPDWRAVAAVVRENDPRTSVVVLDEDRPTRRACLGYYLDPSIRLVPAPREVDELTRRPPEPTVWEVVEVSKGRPLMGPPEALDRLYAVEREWQIRGARVTYHRLRPAPAEPRVGDAGRAAPR